MRLNELVAIAPRYARSVNLERDIDDPSGVDGYILTPVGTDFLSRMQRMLSGQQGSRAWSITGPYGSGKSAFVLFLLNLLSGTSAASRGEAHRILRKNAPDIASELLGRSKRASLPSTFCPVLVTGTANSIAPCLLQSTLRDVARFSSRARRFPSFEVVARLMSQSQRGKAVPLPSVVAAIKALIVDLRKAEICRGIVIVIDELGKFLEHAAHHTESNDIFLLQLIAEATDSREKPSLLLITILHQSFEQYASGLRPVIRNEWAKVQGRFEDVAFQDAPEETLRVISSAINRKVGREFEGYTKAAEVIAKGMHEIGCAPQSLSARQFHELMSACAPLHPAAALALTRLCRKFGQNQRSLFSFLTSRNANGFSTFLQREAQAKRPELYGLPELYDYSTEALGAGLNVGEAGTRWAEVNAALERHPDLSPVEVRLLKSVGLLFAIGAQGEFKSSIRLLQILFGREEARIICDSLERKSVLVFRKHSDSFALWQGSDIDLKERVEEAGRRLSSVAGLASRIDKIYTARPLVAKRHSFATGTLRYYRIRFADSGTFTRMIEKDSDADGVVLYAVPSSAVERQELVRLAMNSHARERLDVLVAIPNNVESLGASFRDLELLRWVQRNTPSLEGDVVARRELRARLEVAEKAVELELHQLFSPVATSSTTWFHRGIEQKILSPRGLSHLLSDICDYVYPSTPILKNELLNRRFLSSAAAKARRNLVEAMVTAADKPKLGISGFPPELSMYRSLLEANGLHREMDGSYVLTAPKEGSSVHSAWLAIEHFFCESELQKRKISELFARLEAPPYGMKMGVIPVVFCAAAIVHDTEIAIYENSAFVPDVTVDVFERLLKSPETFELRSYRIEGVRKAVFTEYAKLLGAVPAPEDNLVAIIKPLYRFFNRLQDYTKRTSTLSQKATAIRQALLEARDPDQILFHDLPLACGFEPFGLGKPRPDSIREFFHELQSGLSELQRCYDDLLLRLQELLYHAFDLKGDSARKLLRQRVASIAQYAVEPRMKAFILHLQDEELSDAHWIEAVGTLLAGKPPKFWADADHAKYEVVVSELSRSLRHIEALVFELARPEVASDSAAEVFRIGITDRYSKEMEAVVSVNSTDADLLAQTILDLEGMLERIGLSEQPALSLAALAAVSKNFLARLGDAPSAKQIKVRHAS